MLDGDDGSHKNPREEQQNEAFHRTIQNEWAVSSSEEASDLPRTRSTTFRKFYSLRYPNAREAVKSICLPEY